MRWEELMRPLLLEAFDGLEFFANAESQQLQVAGVVQDGGWLFRAHSLSPNHRFMWLVLRYVAGVEGAQRDLLDWFEGQARSGHQSVEWMSTTYDLFYVEPWCVAWSVALKRGDRLVLQSALRFVRGMLSLWFIHWVNGRIIGAGCRCGAIWDDRRSAVFCDLVGRPLQPAIEATAQRQRWFDFSYEYTWGCAMARALRTSGRWLPGEEHADPRHLPRLRHELEVTRFQDGGLESYCSDLSGIHGWPLWFVSADPTGFPLVSVRRSGPEAKRGGGGPIPSAPLRRDRAIGRTWKLGPATPVVPVPEVVLPSHGQAPPKKPSWPPAEQEPPEPDSVEPLLDSLLPDDAFGAARFGWFLNQQGEEVLDRLIAYARREAEGGRPKSLDVLIAAARAKGA